MEPQQHTLRLPMHNGASVLRADIHINDDGIGEGVVLARYSDEGHDLGLVIWRVYLHKGETQWIAEHGEYDARDMDDAVRRYNERRAQK